MNQAASDLLTYVASCQTTDETARTVGRAFIAADGGGVASLAELLASWLPGIFQARISTTDAVLATELQAVLQADARAARDAKEREDVAVGRKLADQLIAEGYYSDAIDRQLSAHAGDPAFVRDFIQQLSDAPSIVYMGAARHHRTLQQR